jgi:hemoglobin
MGKQLPDIRGREEVEQLVRAFYEKVLLDPVIGYIFTEVVKLDLEAHLPRMYDFWEFTLFHTGQYRGNPMQLHVKLNEKEALKEAHFTQWLALFNETVDELFEGPVAFQAKTRAQSIATMMQIRIHQAGGLI